MIEEDFESSKETPAYNSNYSYKQPSSSFKNAVEQFKKAKKETGSISKSASSIVIKPAQTSNPNNLASSIKDAKKKTIYASVAPTKESKKNDENNNSTHLPTSRKSSLKQDENDGEQSEVKQGIETDKMNITLPSSYNFSNENNFSDNINTPGETWQEKIVQEQDKAITTEAISGNEIACREEGIEK